MNDRYIATVLQSVLTVVFVRMRVRGPDIGREYDAGINGQELLGG